MQYSNPKLVGSKIIDAVPVAGECPLNCTDCYGNRPGAFYAPLDAVILPPVEETVGKVVRVNSRNDSNINKDEVISLTECYKDKFYNTSLPDMDFPAPVVFTCNGIDMDDSFFKLEDVSNVMFVRVKFNSWNGGLVDQVVRYYTSRSVPVVLTDMRYYTEWLVKKPEEYEWRKHVLNPYWSIKHDVWREVWMRYRHNPFVFSCGSPRSSLCKDCHNCYTLYWAKRNGYSLRTLRLIKAVQAVSFDPILAGGKNVFLIASCVDRLDIDKVRQYVSALEDEGKSVHWHVEDSPQRATEWDSCIVNGKAMLASDEVHILWDQASASEKFYLGMAFMLNLIKGLAGTRVRLKIVNLSDLRYDPARTCFENLLVTWEHEVVDWDE